MLTPLFLYVRLFSFMSKFHYKPFNTVKKIINFFKNYGIQIIIFLLILTNVSYAKIYTVKDIQIIEPFDLNFKKTIVIEKAFISAFDQLVAKTVSSENHEKAITKNINIIKPMIDSFFINNEKFKDNFYSAEFEVIFDKRKILNHFNSLNIVSSSPKKIKILFIPILVNINNNEALMFNENNFYLSWNSLQKSQFLINYTLPSEDLEDFSFINSNIKNIENYSFEEIISKYNKDNYIISIFFLNKGNIKVLSKIKFNNNMSIVRSNFKNFDINNNENIIDVIKNLKIKYENIWKKENEINTEIKLPITLSIDSKNFELIKLIEKKFLLSDLVYDFRIEKFDSSLRLYRIIYNGPPDKFLNDFSDNNIKVDTSSRVWKIK